MNILIGWLSILSMILKILFVASALFWVTSLTAMVALLAVDYCKLMSSKLKNNWRGKK